MLSSSDVDVSAVTEFLDGLGNEERIAEVTNLRRPEQRRLFQAVKDHHPIRVTDFVPAENAPFSEVVFAGRNTLPAFTRFAKIFCRPDDDDAAGELWGYNRSTGFVETTVGPGFFVAYDHGDTEILVDYLRVPPKRPEHWPAILDNDTRLSFFVYNGTQDVVRGVSEHVRIGRASRRGRTMNVWFVLCRNDDPKPDGDS